MKFVLLFSQQHLDFRIAELRGVCDALAIPLDISCINTKEHIFVVDLPDESSVRRLLSRSMLVKSAYRHLASAPTYYQLHEQLDQNKCNLETFNRPDQSFSVKVRPVGRKKGLDCLNVAQVVCQHLPLDSAPVSLNDPVNAFCVLEEYAHEKATEPQRLFFCLFVDHGQFKLKSKYNLTDRCYIGNTTMDPELAFIQANIAGVKMDSLVLDPFVGTGGLLLSAAAFGGYVVGTEINYAVARGIGRSSRQGVEFLSDRESIAANFDQYGTSHRLLGVLIADASQHGLWRSAPVFDAIVSDPPYGVREKARKVGKKERKEHWTLPGSEHESHFPEKQNYSLEASFVDLCDMAAAVLVVGGKLTFWFPVILESYSPACLPAHPALEIVDNCEQGLTRKTSRRLLTYRKTREPVCGEKTTTAENLFEKGTFREAVFLSSKQT